MKALLFLACLIPVFSFPAGDSTFSFPKQTNLPFQTVPVFSTDSSIPPQSPVIPPLFFNSRNFFPASPAFPNPIHFLSALIPQNTTLATGINNPVLFPENFLLNPFFTSRAPFSDIYFYAGSKNEQLLNCFFSQDIKQRGNLSFGLIRTNGEGILRKSSFFAGEHFASFFLNGKFNNRGMALLLYQKSIKKDEPTGYNDTLLREDNSAFITFVPPLRPDARSKLIQSKAEIKFWLAPGHTKSDSLKPKMFLVLAESEFNSFKYAYTDLNPANANYTIFYNDSTITRDSIRLLRFENRVGTLVSPLNGKFSKSYFKLLGGTRNYTLSQNDSLSTPTDIFARAEFILLNEAGTGKSWQLKASSEFIPAGDNAGSFFHELKGCLRFPKHLFGFSASSAFTPRAVTHHFMNFNHNQWKNSFGNQSHDFFSAFYVFEPLKLQAAVNHHRLSNFSFPDSNGIPTLSNQTMAWSELSLKRNSGAEKLIFIPEFKFFFAKNSPINLPSLTGTLNLGWTFSVGKGLGKISLGTLLNYSQAWSTPTYEPATGQWQQSEGNLTHGYFFPDFYFSMKVKRFGARVFSGNPLAGIFEPVPMLYTGIPVSPRNFSFGIAWSFTD
jgi:hypothetical protein